MEYKTKLVQNLATLHQQYDEKLAKGGGMWGMLYLSVKNEIPKLLQVLDEDEEIRGKVEAFLKEVVKGLE